MGCCSGRQQKQSTFPNQNGEFLESIDMFNSMYHKSNPNNYKKSNLMQQQNLYRSEDKFDHIAKNLFYQADLDCDGVLDFYEFQQLMNRIAIESNSQQLTQYELTKLFQETDENKDNFIQYQEFKKLVFQILGRNPFQQISNNNGIQKNIQTNQNKISNINDGITVTQLNIK